MAQKLVVGWVDKFFPERGFGFVSTSEGEVFIHVDRCREFTGTPEKPGIGKTHLGEDWVSKNLIPARGHGGRRHDYSYVVMKVVPGQKGPRAAVWAVIPRRRTVEDIMTYGGLDSYLGKGVAVLADKPSSPEDVWGALAEWSLLEDCLTLVLEEPRKVGNVRVKGPITRAINFTSMGVREDCPERLELLFRREDAPSLKVVLWRREPRS